MEAAEADARCTGLQHCVCRFYGHLHSRGHAWIMTERARAGGSGMFAHVAHAPADAAVNLPLGAALTVRQLQWVHCEYHRCHGVLRRTQTLHWGPQVPRAHGDPRHYALLG